MPNQLKQIIEDRAEILLNTSDIEFNVECMEDCVFGPEPRLGALIEDFPAGEKLVYFIEEDMSTIVKQELLERVEEIVKLEEQEKELRKRLWNIMTRKDILCKGMGYNNPSKFYGNYKEE